MELNGCMLFAGHRQSYGNNQATHTKSSGEHRISQQDGTIHAWAAGASEFRKRQSDSAVRYGTFDFLFCCRKPARLIDIGARCVQNQTTKHC